MLLFYLSGKIAATTGHSAWISSVTSRHRVSELRGRSDAIVVGGNTIRKDGKFHHFCCNCLLLLSIAQVFNGSSFFYWSILCCPLH